jgi:hypothetical protein
MSNCCKQAISPTIGKISVVGEIAILRQQSEFGFWVGESRSPAQR